ncbi:MAG: glycosyltransferase family 2 protein [Candidatus Omnitrophica bacterium]|nr:glycosyltransferase family 2 protein [Candidatus Omnitrophota bacterium]
MNKALFVSIVIRTKNRKEALQQVIASILASDYSNYNLVIVDDGSSDGTKEFLQKHYSQDKRFILIRNEKKISTAFLYNLGVKHSTGEIIAFTDDDCIVNKDWLKELTRPFIFSKDVMAVGGLSYVKNTNEPYMYAGGIFGCNMAFRSKIFEKFSFDPNLKYSHYHDERDLIDRIRKHHFRIWYAERAIVRHFELYNSYRENKYFQLGAMLNRIYTEAKNVPLAQVLTYHILMFRRASSLSLELHKEHHFNIFTASISFLKLFYIVLFEIPVKSQIRHKQEERMLHRAAGGDI